MPLPPFFLLVSDADPSPILYETDKGMLSSVLVDATSVAFLGAQNPPADPTGKQNTGIPVTAASGQGERRRTGLRARGIEFTASLIVTDQNGLTAERTFRKRITIFRKATFDAETFAKGKTFPGKVIFTVQDVGNPLGAPVDVIWTVSRILPEAT